MPDPLAKKSEEQVVLSLDGFPLKYLGQWMAQSGCPNLTVEDAKKLLKDKEFVEILLQDIFSYATDVAEDESDGFDALDTYADVLNRLGVPHDGNLEDDSDLHDDYDSDIEEEVEDEEEGGGGSAFNDREDDPLSDVIEDQNVPD